MGNYFNFNLIFNYSTFRSWIRMSGEGEKSEWHTLSNNVIFKIGTSSSYYVNCSCIKEKNYRKQRKYKFKLYYLLEF